MSIAPNLEHIDILFVDDSRNMHQIMKTILNAMRIKQIRFAENAADAFVEMRTRMPDILITDWKMQPLDGLDFVRLVRRGSDSPNPFIPILLLTAHTEMHRVLEARDAGVHDVVAKPVSIAGLYKKILTIIEHPRPFVRSEKYFGPQWPEVGDLASKQRQILEARDRLDVDSAD